MARLAFSSLAETNLSLLIEFRRSVFCFYMAWVGSGRSLHSAFFTMATCYSASNGRIWPVAFIRETMGWEPISETDLWSKIINAEGRMSPQTLRLWEAIKIPPQKWAEQTYGTVGGGFWVVAIIGNKVIWFNDIEDGFNCSCYVVLGKLDEYFCNQDEFEVAVQDVLKIIETGSGSTARCSAPLPGEWKSR